MFELIIICAIIYAVYRKYGKEMKRFRDNRPGQTRPVRPNVFEEKPDLASQASESGDVFVPSKRKKNTINRHMRWESESTLMDDREHDWLAMQRAEESKALRRVSEMFELKAEHASSCDAEMLRRFHEKNHGME